MLRPIVSGTVDGRLATRIEQPREEVRIAAVRDDPALATDALKVGVSEPAVLATGIDLLPGGLRVAPAQFSGGVLVDGAVEVLPGDARVPLTWAQVAAIGDAYTRFVWVARVPAARIPAGASDPCEYVQAALDARRAARTRT